MCKRHSFAVTPDGRVLDGCGLTDSHTTILDMAGLSASEHDRCNLYEWQPPKGWPKTSWIHGLTVDQQVFEPKSSHDKAARSHLLALYPSREAWDEGDTIRWEALDLPDAERVHCAYDLALRAAPLATVSESDIIVAVDEHLRRLGLDIRVTEVVLLSSVESSVVSSVRSSVWSSVVSSVWSRVWSSVESSVWSSVRSSVVSSMVREDDVNVYLPLAELAIKGAYLYGVTDEGVCYVIAEKVSR